MPTRPKGNPGYDAPVASSQPCQQCTHANPKNFPFSPPYVVVYLARLRKLQGETRLETTTRHTTERRRRRTKKRGQSGTTRNDVRARRGLQGRRGGAASGRTSGCGVSNCAREVFAPTDSVDVRREPRSCMLGAAVPGEIKEGGVGHAVVIVQTRRTDGYARGGPAAARPCRGWGPTHRLPCVAQHSTAHRRTTRRKSTAGRAGEGMA